MPRFLIKNDVLEKCINHALIDSTLLLQNKIIEITPRDPKRLPKDPSVRVTGNLKRSIAIEQDDKYSFRIGTQQNEAEYGRWLEFGTPYMQPRSFLRKGIYDNKELVMRNFSKVLRKKLSEEQRK